METRGDNKNIGERELHHTEAHPSSSSSSSSSQNPFPVPSDATNNKENSFHEQTNTNSKNPSETSEDDVQNSCMQKHGHDQGSEIQNPQVQVMERPGEPGASPQYIFPSHVFSESNSNSHVEWSIASNESLFSIYMGNTSFSSELFRLKSCELDMPGELCTHDQPNASPTCQPPTPVNKFNDISQRTAEQKLLHEESSKATEAKAAETMREVIMESSQTTESVGKGDGKASNSHGQTDISANSNSSQSSKDRDKGVSTNCVAEKQNQQKQTEENETPKTADQAPKTTKNAPNKWLSCFSCCSFC